MKKNIGVKRQESRVTVRLGKVICGLIISALLGITLVGCGGNPTPTPTPGINNVIGVGVVIQSKSDFTVKSIGGQSLNLEWKKIDLALGTPGAYYRSSTQLIQAASLDLTGKVALILLAWDKVNGADHYQVSYQGTKAWDSATVDTGKDPVFQENSPQAFLDFDDELKNVTLAAGQYNFQVTALSGNTIMAQSSVTASLGRILQSLPVINDFTTTKPNLTWNSVTGANEYRINIAGINSVTVNNSITTYDISTLLSAANPVKQYDVYMDARALDGNGKPVEITRGIGGLSY